MKRIVILLVLYVASAACSVSNIEKDAPGNEVEAAFKAGQKITLTVNTEISTKVSSSVRNDGMIAFKWESGDKILVKMGQASSEFTLINGAGDTDAQFTGTMPASGDSFDVQFPVSTPDISAQTYAEGGLPHNTMLASATGCTKASQITLQPQNAALRLDLWGNLTVGSIVVTDMTASAPKPTWTLSCGTNGVALNLTKTELTPFLLVMPAGSRQIKVEIYDTKSTLLRTFETAGENTFSNAKVLSMPSKALVNYIDNGIDSGPGTLIDDVVWAPVNCGYDATNTNGLLYQWGRKYGQQMKDYSLVSLTKAEGNSDAHSDEYAQFVGEITADDSNWFEGDLDNSMWRDGTKKGEFDPCPAGWRIPTKSELEALSAHRSGWSNVSGQNGYYYSGSTTYSADAARIFLPATGDHAYKSGKFQGGNMWGNYWSSTCDSACPWYLYEIHFSTGTETVEMHNNYGRASGYCVRCVQE